MNVAEWAGDSAADCSWNIPAEKLNDDRLGRGLDAFFEQRHSILAGVALHVSQKFDIPLNELHYDPTHIVFHGAYAGAKRGRAWSMARPFAATETCSLRTSPRAVAAWMRRPAR